MNKGKNIIFSPLHQKEQRQNLFTDEVPSQTFTKP